jgi:hypothetical protein
MRPVHVECYSGYTYAQEPRAVVWRGFRVPVARVERAWLTPEGPAFRVHLETGARVVLLYVQARDRWLLAESDPALIKDESHA